MQRVWKNFTAIGGRGLSVPILAAMLLIRPAVTQAAPATHPAETGEALFQQKCAACHTIGKGKLVGPDLQGVGQRVSRDWMERFIATPDKMLAEKDPIALRLLKESNNILMPNLGLSKAEVDALVSYLESPTEAEHHVPASPETAMALPAQAGKAAVGEGLFTGAIRLQNRGPECMACHSFASAGIFGGGSVGPDLTQVYRRFGQAGLASALGTLPFPTMQGAYRGKPLTQTEQADMLAFFAQENQKNVAPSAATWNFVGIGLAGFIVLTGVSHVLWGKRFTGVRKRLVGGAK
ncbi:MAG: c-type cytochrome [Alphaproteobacteria bacterium]